MKISRQLLHLCMKRFVLKPFWNFETFVLIQTPIWLYYSVKARSLAFFTNVNPIIHLGGFLGYSKYELLKYLDKKWIPKTIFLKVTKTLNLKKIRKILEENNIKFPLILKPDIGERGDGVFKINNLTELKLKLNLFFGKNVLIQEFIDYPVEVGVLYIRLPGVEQGEVVSFALKGYSTVLGDGCSTIRELVKNKKLSLLKVTLSKDDLEIIPEKNELVQVSEIGNKSYGTKFTNLNHFVNKKFNLLFDEITKSIPGFHFGRYDIKAESIELLIAGESIKVLELNGVNSQPIHMFDERISIFETYRILCRSWKTMYQISLANKKLGHKFTSNYSFVNQVWKHYKNKKKNKLANTS